MSKLHSITEAINKTWDFICGTHEWIQESSVQVQECRIMWFLQDDIEVPCITQWRLLWYSAQSHLNKILIRIGALRACYDKAVNKAMETVVTTPFGKGDTPRSVFLEPQRAIIEKKHARVGVSIDKDMKRVVSGWRT